MILFDQAELTAIEKNLNSQLKKVKQERFKLEVQLKDSKQFLEGSLKERLEKLGMAEYLQQIRSVLNPGDSSG